MIKKIGKIFRALYKTISALAYYSITFPIPKRKDLWVFGSWKGRNYSDNSKVLFEYVCKNKKNINAVWIAKNDSIYNYVKNLGYPVVLYKSFTSKLLVARAGVNIQTESNEDTGTYRVGRTKVIQLFHGAGGIKEAYVYGGMHGLKKALVKIYADNHSKSYWMVGSDYYYHRYPELFECNPKLIRITGSPRTDVLLANRKIEYFENIKEKFKSIKFIAYTPTHRNFAQNTTVYLNEDSWVELNIFLKKNNYILFFKPHPLELFKYINNFKKYSNIVLITDELIKETTDFNEYMHYFDMLISDYSSISSDYLLFDRPIIHFMYDRDTFEDEFFKLNALDKFVAGPIVYNLHDLKDKIHESFIMDSYKDVRRNAIKNAYKFIDTNNCERIYQSIIEILDNE
ncbi:MAG: hypothetical protein HDR88_06995 [Bacteroides sp.]|nr:hypothetical protein [Bacteroides sp.]